MLQKVMWHEISTLKFISLPPPEFLQTTSHSLGLPTLSWLGTFGKLTSWKGNVRLVGCRLIGWQPSPLSHEVRRYMMFCCQARILARTFWIPSLRTI